MRLLYVCFMSLLLFVSCENSRYYSSAINNTQSPPEAENKRKLLYQAAVKIECIETDSANRQLNHIASRYAGYAQELGPQRSVIRVKSDQLQTALGELGGLGKILHKTVSCTDVTEQYEDLDLRLDNARKARTRYLELLARAEHVEAALKVEKELERLNAEIEGLEGKMKKMDHLHAYSTIEVTWEKPLKPGVIGYLCIGIYKGIRWLFVRG